MYDVIENTTYENDPYTRYEESQEEDSDYCEEDGAPIPCALGDDSRLSALQKGALPKLHILDFVGKHKRLLAEARKELSELPDETKLKELVEEAHSLLLIKEDKWEDAKEFLSLRETQENLTRLETAESQLVQARKRWKKTSEKLEEVTSLRTELEERIDWLKLRANLDVEYACSINIMEGFEKFPGEIAQNAGMLLTQARRRLNSIEHKSIPNASDKVQTKRLEAGTELAGQEGPDAFWQKLLDRHVEIRDLYLQHEIVLEEIYHFYRDLCDSQELEFVWSVPSREQLLYQQAAKDAQKAEAALAKRQEELEAQKKQAERSIKAAKRYAR